MISSFEICFIIYMVCLSFLGTVSNFPILLVYRNRASNNASIYLLFSLALVNLLISLIVVPFSIFASVQDLYINDRFYCGLSYFLRYFANSISVVLLALIAFERYNTISAKTMTRLRVLQKSLIYNSKRGTVVAVVLCFILTVWCFYFIDNLEKCCTPVDSFIYYNIFCSVVLGLILFLMIILYIKSYLIVHRSTTKIFIKNLDSTQSKTTKTLNFLVKFTNQENLKTFSENSEELSQDKSMTEYSSYEYKKDEAVYSFNRRQSIKNKANNASMNNFYTASSSNSNETRKGSSVIETSQNFKTNKKLNTISETQEVFRKRRYSLQPSGQKNEVVFNDVLNFVPNDQAKAQEINYRSRLSSISSKLFLTRTKETYIDSSLPEESSARIYVINENDTKNKEERPDLFKKRLSNLSVSNSFIRKDWQVARMFFLVILFI